MRFSFGLDRWKSVGEGVVAGLGTAVAGLAFARDSLLGGFLELLAAEDTEEPASALKGVFIAEPLAGPHVLADAIAPARSSLRGSRGARSKSG